MATETNQKSLRLSPLATPPEAEILLSGSKSFANRALILSSVASGVSEIINCSESEDTGLLVRALSEFGVEVETEQDKLLIKPPVDGLLKVPKSTIDIGPAGTVMRFLTAFSASVAGAEVILQGTERMHQRPIDGLVDALRKLGVKIEYLGTEGCPPLKILGEQISGGEISIDGSMSSQFLTALLLVAPRFDKGLRLIPEGKCTSQSYLRMTLQTLRHFGVNAYEDSDGAFVVPPSPVKGSKYVVEGDGSGASYFWGIAALTGGRIAVGPFTKDSVQGDLGFPTVLEMMGCEVVRDHIENTVSVTGPRDRHLRAIDINMENMPDTAQTLAVIAAVAEGTTVIRGLHTLRIKETDRISAVQVELEKLGVKSEATEDTLTVHGISPDKLQAACIDTYHDHRMAMSFGMLGAITEGVTINEPSVVGKSFPDFWERLASLGVGVS